MYMLSLLLANRASFVFLLLMFTQFIAGCNVQISGLPATERLEMETLVEDYFTAASATEADLPQYEARVEEVSGNWARVALWPVGVDNAEPNLFFLERQEIDPNTANQTPHGWTIILGPQVHFAASELDSAGVPMDVRS